MVARPRPGLERGPDVEAWTPIVANLGFPIALVLYLLWNERRKDEKGTAEEKKRDDERAAREQKLMEDMAARENRMAARLDKIEDERQRDLVRIIERTTQVHVEVATTNRRVVKSVDALLDLLRAGPCFTDTALKNMSLPSARVPSKPHEDSSSDFLQALKDTP
jgi:hypothetical protein